MNVLMLSLLYPQDSLAQVTRNVKDKLQNQVNSYQRAFLEGIGQNLIHGERLDIANSLPVGVFPIQYRKIWIPKGWHDSHSLYELGCLNLPWFKQRGRMHRATDWISGWYEKNPENRTVLLYTLYLPYLEAVARAKQRCNDFKACVIVTDLPNELGLPSGRTGLLKQIEYARGRKSLSLINAMDGFVLLTRPMADALKVGEKPYIVIEGLIQQTEDKAGESAPHPADGRPAVLYTGTLERDLGIPELLRAFELMPEYDLWICGQGNMQAEVAEAAGHFGNIFYYGFVPQKEALRLQARASLLVNPRSPRGAFTRFSFPSKTLEYMRSGKPVLCYKLEGIPDDYDPYLHYIQSGGPEGIVKAVRGLLSLPADELAGLGKRAREFVQTCKTPDIQCKRLTNFLRGL